jgi:hypothetical protein
MLALRSLPGRGAVGAIAGLAAAVVADGCSPPSGPEPAPGQPVYVGEATIDPATGSVAAQFTIRFVTDASMTDGVAFLLNGRLDISRFDGDGVRSVGERPRNEGGDWKQIDVAWSEPAPAGELRELHVAYEGVLFDSLPSDPINSIRHDWIELGLDAAWHPVFASFDQALVGELTLHIPAGWTVVASGEVTRARGAYHIRSSVPQVDFAFAAGPELRQAGSVDVTVYHTDAQPATVEKLVNVARACREWLTLRIGELPDLKLLLAPRHDGGYARKNYVVLTRVDEYPPPALSRFVCHELAHYWSSAASPSTADYWMTEAFAELISARHVRDVYGDTAYAPILEQWREQSEGLPAIWTDTATARPSFRISYRKAPLVLAEFESEIGAEAFAGFLRRYMTESTRTTRQLLGQVERAGGIDARHSLEAALAR